MAYVCGVFKIFLFCVKEIIDFPSFMLNYILFLKHNSTRRKIQIANSSACICTESMQMNDAYATGYDFCIKFYDIFKQ